MSSLERMSQERYCDAVEWLRTTGWPESDDDASIRVFIAASQIIRDRRIRAGQLGEDDGYSPTQEDIKEFFAKGFTSKQWKSLKKIADMLIIRDPVPIQ